ncbi:Glycosyl hydrolase family 3 N terminal domain-containing protein [Bifidobacterium lemurum]|uniref:Glycosyl hydrolase family 3 N terminal domain-containing protein n=1 Tax=Bifidobacterium lemurum TaxID=1603886 RepID=A0A261FL92_9BIFI|nr:glycoside hydrolase family 3 protein [Bifidobacterium lemurum]OZG59733.1 Glycosyl hydrolase family 3 N terminal domain-containing protein [Bifidobacterium lemurum]QOL35027.1 glycoside hydrolase family 3 protein [Bifidobacterium lemurum]
MHMNQHTPSNGRRILLRAGTAVCALLAGLSLTATTLTEANASKVHNFLGTNATQIVNDGDENEDTTYFASEFDSWEDAYNNALDTNQDIQEEGSVLVENNGALPLASGARVSMFSRSSTDIVYGGTGSGSIDESTVVDLKTAMESAGFSINQTLYDFYDGQEGYTRTTSDVAEVPVSEFTSEVEASYADYSDAAIVVISRTGGEGDDLDADTAYLNLQDSERELLDYVQQRFDTVVVLVNSSNAMSLDWLDDYGVDACLWIGGPGQSGLTAVAEMLNGTRTPSGKFTDTYAADSLSSPAMQNFGDYTYTNATTQASDGASMSDTVYDLLTDSSGNVTEIANAKNYVVYAEGIYVGYAYYETRYEDSVLGQGNADGDAGTFASSSSWDYDEEVNYAFGYGQSYTTFEQTLDSVDFDGDKATVTVTVTNTGDTYSGKDVVEVYAQAPYIEGGLEKASVQLCGYDKTEELAPGESETLTIDVDLRDIASYDSENEEAYVLDEGTYYLAIGSDAHNALNNILAAKGMTTADGMDEDGDADKTATTELDYTVYDTDENSGNAIENRFEDADLNYYQDDTVTYLSRSDWQGTWPESYDSVEATDEMIADLENNYTANEAETTEITYGADNGLNIATMRDADYDDEAWDQLLDQMTLEEQVELVQNGASQTAAVESIAFPGSVDADGPAGLGSSTGRRYYLEDINDKDSATTTSAVGYNSSVVIASTWSRDMARQRGEAIGEDGLWTNTQGWWGPGANTHRTPYGGRNFEYYSEDSFLGGTIGAEDIAGAQSKGLRSFVKHFAVNDQELNRHGLSTFANEQSLRQIYLKQFEYVVKDGGTLSLMSSFNRIGVKWAGGDAALCTDLLRDEWGFVGSVETDFNFHATDGYMNVRSGLRGGTDQWLAMGESGLIDFVKEDADLAAEVREACHRILYSISRSSAINGIGSSGRIVKTTVWWQWLLYGMTGVTGVLTLAQLGLLGYGTVRDERRREAHITVAPTAQ